MSPQPALETGVHVLPVLCASHESAPAHIRVVVPSERHAAHIIAMHRAHDIIQAPRVIALPVMRIVVYPYEHRLCLVGMRSVKIDDAMRIILVLSTLKFSAQLATIRLVLPLATIMASVAQAIPYVLALVYCERCFVVAIPTFFYIVFRLRDAKITTVLAIVGFVFAAMGFANPNTLVAHFIRRGAKNYYCPIAGSNCGL